MAETKSKREFEVLLLSGRFELRGSTTQMLHLAEQLPEHKIGATILCPNARQLDPSRRNKLKVLEYPYLDKPLLRHVILQFIKYDLDERRPQLIHIQSRRMLAQGIWLARELECPFVLTIHDYIPTDEKFEFDHTWGKQVIAVSESVKSDLLSLDSISNELVTVVRSGIVKQPPEEMMPILAPNQVPVIGTAGPLEDVKGIPYFLKAARKVLDEREPVEFLIAGSGPEEAALRALSRDLGLTKHITFVPNLHDFSKSLRAMDVFCLPSLKQGLGTIMLEAMAMGKPVIASRVGGIFSVIEDGVTGHLVPPSDSNALAECMLKTLSDPIQTRLIGEAGRQMVANEFRFDRMVQETIDVYHNALQQQTPEVTSSSKVGTE